MKPMNEVYPPESWHEGAFYAPSNYQPLLESIGHEIVVQVDEDNYSGDSWLLLRDGKRIGYLCFGWGSCSGCDALQAADSYADLEKLRSELVSQIKWFESASEALAWFETHDWEGDYSSEEEKTAFVAQSKAWLADEARSD